MTSVKINQKNYNLWSRHYDNYPNPTVMMDEMALPLKYSDWMKYKVLEIGCGTGRHTQRLHQQNNEVVAIDVSDGMLEKAKQKSKGVEFIHADFMDYHFQSASFDKILMSLVLEHISELDIFFEKIHNILAKKGEFLFSELHPIRAKQGSLAHFKIDNGEEIWMSSKAHSEEEIITAATKAGLNLNFKLDIYGNREFCEKNEKWQKYLNTPMIQIWSFLY